MVSLTYLDTFHTVNLEVLACGSPEAIDSKTGIVIEQGSVVALANAIMDIKRHPLSSTDCRNRAIELFDKDKCFEKYIELYECLIKG